MTDGSVGPFHAPQAPQGESDSGANMIDPVPPAGAPGIDGSPQERERRRRRHGLMWAWVLVVVLYFAWEAAAYRGLFAYLAEWEFDRIGQDLPTFNFGLLSTMFAWPALRLFRSRREAAPSEHAGMTADERIANQRLHAQEDAGAAVDVARDYMHFLYGFTVALFIAAMAALLWTLALPRMGPNLREVALNEVRPPEGPSRLSGTVNYGRIASFSRGLLFVRRSELYAPILAADGNRLAVRYFVEFSPDERRAIRSGNSLTRRTGILVRSDLPGALVRLYRYLGYLPAKPYYVLYASALTIRWPYYIIAAQFILGGLVFLGSGLLQRRHIRRLERDHAALFARQQPWIAAPQLRLTAG